MRLLLANLHAPSDPVQVARWFRHTVVWNEVDIACLQEMTTRHKAHLPWNCGLGLGQVAVAIPGKGFRHWKRIGSKGWFGWRANKPHPTRWLTYIEYPFGNVGSTHAPPGVDATPGGLRGKADRVAAWVSFVRAFRRWAKHNPGPFVVAADWNDQPWHRGTFSVRWLARKTGAVIVGDGIDYLLVRGVQAHHIATIAGGPGMDHDAQLFWIGD